MEACGDGIIMGFVIGFIIGIFIGLATISGVNEDDFKNTRNKLIENEKILNETIIERDTYKNLILEKNLEGNV